MCLRRGWISGPLIYGDYIFLRASPGNVAIGTFQIGNIFTLIMMVVMEPALHLKIYESFWTFHIPLVHFPPLCFVLLFIYFRLFIFFFSIQSFTLKASCLETPLSFRKYIYNPTHYRFWFWRCAKMPTYKWLYKPWR